MMCECNAIIASLSDGLLAAAWMPAFGLRSYLSASIILAGGGGGALGETLNDKRHMLKFTRSACIILARVETQGYIINTLLIISCSADSVNVLIRWEGHWNTNTTFPSVDAHCTYI